MQTFFALENKRALGVQMAVAYMDKLFWVSCCDWLCLTYLWLGLLCFVHSRLDGGVSMIWKNVNAFLRVRGTEECYILIGPKF
jgi:hypothetical protein